MSNVKIFTDNVEQEAINQIATLVKQPAFENSKIRIMPDVHAGTGCVIGFTANLGNKVIPNIVGVDIGCGMLCCVLGKIDIDLSLLDYTIRKTIPSGRNVNETYKPTLILEPLTKPVRDALNDKERILCSIGTLGGGNHFIEIDEDSDGVKYLIIHTGSRNLGTQVAKYYQNLAISNLTGRNRNNEAQKNLIARLKREGKSRSIEAMIKQFKEDSERFNPAIPKELCYLEGEDAQHYLHDMYICQRFARRNRKEIAQRITNFLRITTLFSFGTVHNYIDPISGIVRKGAVSAKLDEKLLIPMNMRDGCLICTGKGNADWNYSAPHGAGRAMSRTEAREHLDLKEYKEQMNGIFTTSVSEKTIDEAPMAYKPMQEILENIKDTVTVNKVIRPIYNFKAEE